MNDTPTASPPAAPAPRHYAVVVGVDRYQDAEFLTLQYCSNDARHLAATLRQLGYQVVALHQQAQADGEPGLIDVDRLIQECCRRTEAGDSILIYFACHGLREDERTHLILSDSWRSMLRSHSLTAEVVEGYLRDEGLCKARRRTLILDVCHAPIRGARGVADEERFFENVYRAGEGLAVFAASSAHNQAYERDGHGVYTSFLIDGLRGHAANPGRLVTVKGLQDYLSHQMAEWVRRSGLRQEPRSNLTEAQGDLVLADYRGRAYLYAAGRPARNPFLARRGLIPADEGDRFFGREIELRAIFDLLRQRHSCAVVGDIQIGKSSLLQQVARRGPDELGLATGQIIYLDPRLASGDAEFYALISARLGSSPRDRSGLIALLHERQYVLCIDEIEYLKSDNGISRNVRSMLRACVESPEARLALVVAARRDIATIFPDDTNTESDLGGVFTPVRLEPWRAKEARRFLAQRLGGTGVSFSDAEIAELLEISQRRPYDLQRLARELFDRKLPAAPDDEDD